LHRTLTETVVWYKAHQADTEMQEGASGRHGDARRDTGADRAIYGGAMKVRRTDINGVAVV